MPAVRTIVGPIRVVEMGLPRLQYLISFYIQLSRELRVIWQPQAAILHCLLQVPHDVLFRGQRPHNAFRVLQPSLRRLFHEHLFHTCLV